MLPMIKQAVALLLTAAGSTALAQDYPTKVWLNPGAYSHHFKRDQDHREENHSLGFLAGGFIHSTRERSRYGGYHWRAWQWKPSGVNVSAGVVFALFDGYSNQNGGGGFPGRAP